MKTRIVKIYDKWVVEFPFACVVYCHSFAQALEAFHQFDAYLEATATAAVCRQ